MKWFLDVCEPHACTHTHACTHLCLCVTCAPQWREPEGRDTQIHTTFRLQHGSHSPHACKASHPGAALTLNPTPQGNSGNGRSADEELIFREGFVQDRTPESADFPPQSPSWIPTTPRGPRGVGCYQESPLRAQTWGLGSEGFGGWRTREALLWG